MNFNLQRHTRIAGCVLIFAGLFLKNWNIVLFGNLGVAIGYMWAINKIERHLEEINPEKEEDDAVR